MSKYTLQDIDLLPSVVGEVEQWYDQWPQTLAELKKTSDDPDKILEDLICYVQGLFTNEMRTFIFNVSVQEMPLYFGDEDSVKAIISRWRMQIGK
jgi:hypothetical protein